MAAVTWNRLRLPGDARLGADEVKGERLKVLTAVYAVDIFALIQTRGCLCARRCESQPIDLTGLVREQHR